MRIAPLAFIGAVFLRFVKYWLPVLLWMAIIFSASTDLMSASKTSRFIGPFLRWFNPSITDETIRAIQFGIRKTAHVMEYAILALLVWRAVRSRVSLVSHSWSWGNARFVILFCACYAGTDELHQSYVPTRQGSVWDVILDTTGAALAMLLLWRYGRWRKFW